jgi:dihydrofolate reductase
VVGGAQIYELALPACRRVFLTRILQEIDGDVFFPINEIRPPLWKRVELDGPHFCEKENLNYQFENYERND